MRPKKEAQHAVLQHAELFLYRTNNPEIETIKRNDFQIWLKQYNIEYVPEICGIPLGKVTSGREFLIRKYYKSVHKQNFDIKVNN